MVINIPINDPRELLYKCPAPKTELAETSMKMTENKT